MFKTIKENAIKWAENDWQNQVVLADESEMKVYNNGDPYTIDKDKYFSELEQIANFSELEQWYNYIMGADPIPSFGRWIDIVSTMVK